MVRRNKRKLRGVNYVVLNPNLSLGSYRERENSKFISRGLIVRIQRTIRRSGHLLDTTTNDDISGSFSTSSSAEMMERIRLRISCGSATRRPPS